MWPLKMCEITASTVKTLDAKANSYLRKWLGLPRCLSDAALFGRNALQLPLKSITTGYRLEKTRLVLELRQSSDHLVRTAGAKVRTGRAWKAEECVDNAISRLKHKELVGATQQGRHGLGWGEPTKFWSKASAKDRKAMVVTEVTRMEEDKFHVKSVGQCQQGQWTKWEGVLPRSVGWNDIWKMPQARLSYLIRSTYDTLPSPSNLARWYGAEENCGLCGAAPGNLRHILSGCRTALAQGRYRWRHDQVLRKLAEHTENMRILANGRPKSQQRQHIHFISADQPAKNPPQGRTPVLAPGAAWSMTADLDKQLRFPTIITTTTLRPDIVLWSVAEKRVLLVELTVPWEQGLQEAYERKKLRYTDLVAECQEKGWRATTYPVEVGCRGFISLSTQRFLRDLGFTAGKSKGIMKDLAEEAEKGSFWLWLRRKDKTWGNQAAV